MAIQISGLSAIARDTLADGEWFNKNIIKIADDDLKAIASALDDNGISSLPDVKASANLGASAWEKIKNYNIPEIHANAISGASAWKNVSSFDYAGACLSAYSGFKAAEKVLPYDITTIINQANLGYAAYKNCSAFDMSALLNSAKDARAGYNLLSAYNPTIQSILSSYNEVTAISALGLYAMYDLQGSSARWNDLTANLQANGPTYSAVNGYETPASPSAKHVNDASRFVQTACIGFNRLDSTLPGSSAEYNNMTTAVSAYSARWNRMDNGQRGGYGASAWNMLPGDTATFRHLSAVSANSAVWKNMQSVVTTCADKFDSTVTTLANKDSWLIPGNYTNYTNMVNTLRGNSGKYNSAFYYGPSGLSSISGWMNNAKTVLDASAGKWNEMNRSTDFNSWTRTHTVVMNNSANWEKAWTSAHNVSSFLDVFSSHSGTQTTPKWEQMAYDKSNWYGKIGTWTSITTGNSAYWNDLSKFRTALTGNPSYSAALSAASGKSYSYVSASDNYSAWYMLHSYASDSSKAEALTNMYKTYTANSATKWVRTVGGNNASLKILRRKGWFTKHHTDIASNISNIVWLLS